MISFEDFRVWCYDAYPRLNFRYATNRIVVVHGVECDYPELMIRICENDDIYRSSKKTGVSEEFTTDNDLRKFCLLRWGEPGIPFPLKTRLKDERLRLIEALSEGDYDVKTMNTGRLMVFIGTNPTAIVLTSNLSRVGQDKFERDDMYGFEKCLTKIFKR